MANGCQSEAQLRANCREHGVAPKNIILMLQEAWEEGQKIQLSFESTSQDRSYLDGKVDI